MSEKIEKAEEKSTEQGTVESNGKKHWPKKIIEFLIKNFYRIVTISVGFYGAYYAYLAIKPQKEKKIVNIVRDDSELRLIASVSNTSESEYQKADFWKWQVLKGDKEIELSEEYLTNYFLIIPKSIGYGNFIARAKYLPWKVEGHYEFTIPYPKGIPIFVNDKEYKRERTNITQDLTEGVSIEFRDKKNYELDYWTLNGGPPRDILTPTWRYEDYFEPDQEKVEISINGKIKDGNIAVYHVITISKEKENDNSETESQSDLTDEDALVEVSLPSLKELESLDKSRLTSLFSSYASSLTSEEYYRNELKILDLVTSVDIPVNGYKSLGAFLTRLKMDLSDINKVEILEYQTTDKRVSAITNIRLTR